MTNAAPSSVFHVMSKPTGAICNLDCDYCFFLSKEELYPGSGFRMDAAVHEAYIAQLLAAHAGADEVVVAFQGGEPTMMGLDFFRRTLELEQLYRQPGQHILNTIQTNATLITDEWAAFFRDNGFLVGVSIDGPRAMHDAYRVDKGGKPTFDRVMAGLDVLRRHGVEWNALTTVNAANGDHGREVYCFLRDELGAQFMQFIPIVERVTPEMLDPERRAGWGGQRRPLYTQSGDQVTARSVGRGAVRPLPGRRLRGVGQARRRATCSCRSSTPRWRIGWGWTRSACAYTPAPAATPWPWSTTAISTRATTSWNPTTCSATSPRVARCCNWSSHRSSAPSAKRS